MATGTVKTEIKNNKFLEKVKSTMKNKNYVIYTAPYILNIIGIRSKTRNANLFDDRMVVFYNDDKGNEIILSKNGNKEYYDITTDPGYSSLGYVEPFHNNKTDLARNKYKPNMWKSGCAILKEGQYIDCWQISIHKDYEAICQLQSDSNKGQGKVIVYRDKNKDKVLDTNVSTECGFFDIDIHKPWKTCQTKQVEVYNISAGCQVLADPNDFKKLLSNAKLQVTKGNKKYFSYTLLLEEELL